MQAFSWLVSMVVISSVLFQTSKAFADLKVGGSQGPQEALRIEEVIAEALANNPELKAARERAKAARRRIPQAGALGDVGLGFTYEDIPRNHLDPGTANEEMLFEISQEIPFPGKLTLRRLAAKQEAEMAQAEAQSKEREILESVKEAYFELFLRHKHTEVVKENLELLNQFARTAEAKYAAGRATQADVLKAHVEVSKLMNELISLEQERRTAEALLNTLLNRPVESPLGIPLAPELDRLPSYEELRSLALDQRPELLASKAALGKSRHELLLAKMELLPDFEVSYTPVQTDRGSRFYGVMAKAMIPLWFLQRELPAIGEAKATLRSAEQSYRSVTNETLFEVDKAFAKVDKAKRLVEIYQASLLPQSRQVIGTAQAGYEAGQVDFLDLLDAQRVYRDVERDYYAALADYAVSVAALERAVGIDVFGKGGML